jgi:AIR synthase-related protein
VSLDRSSLEELGKELSHHPAVIEKARIAYAYTPAQEVSAGIVLGDDCAAIPDPVGGGHLLFAAEGMLHSFVEEDPWFAGYSAVMVNLSDIAAMGGRPMAVTDVFWTRGGANFTEVWSGMKAASAAYGVPIVGGHTTQVSGEGQAGLATAVLGRAGDHLITSFDARPGDRLVLAIDMAGAYREGKPFWNASTTTSPARLQSELDLLGTLADRKLSSAGKDISNGGIAGTLCMLCESSGVGVEVDLDALPCPLETPWGKWLTSFPSYGYLLAVAEEKLGESLDLFAESGITCVACGSFAGRGGLTLSSGGQNVRLQFD